MSRQITFYDTARFPWASRLQDGWQDVRRELDDVLAEDRQERWGAFYPDLVERHEPGVRDWLSYTLLYFTIRNELLCQACPKTVELLKSIPKLVTAQFSSLSGRTRIVPHTGYNGVVLRCHLGLHVPEPGRCALRVGADTRHWNEGEVIVFDDRIEHEAWNDGGARRIVLLLDFVRPDLPLSADEVGRLFFRTTTDPAVLGQASRAEWLRWLAQRRFSGEFAPAASGGRRVGAQATRQRPGRS